jgi:hypothetical protein
VRRGASRGAALALLLAVPIATGSCVPRTLRTDQLERRLARDLERTLHVAATVTCPPDIEVRRGAVVICVATDPDGDRVRIRVTQVDDDGAVTWEVVGPDG